MKSRGSPILYRLMIKARFAFWVIFGIRFLDPCDLRKDYFFKIVSQNDYKRVTVFHHLILEKQVSITPDDQVR